MIAGGGIYSFFFCFASSSISPRDTSSSFGCRISQFFNRFFFLLFPRNWRLLCHRSGPVPGGLLFNLLAVLFWALYQIIAPLSAFSVLLLVLLKFRKRAPVIKHALISNQWISLFDVQSLASHQSRPGLRLGALLWCAAILGLFPTCTRRSSGQRLLRFVLPLSSLINWIDFRQQLICLMIHS